METTQPRIGLDSGLCVLTIQLTINEAAIIRALLNSPDRTNFSFYFGGDRPAEFIVPATIKGK